MSLATRSLYRIAFSLLAALGLIGIGLLLFQHEILSTRPIEHEVAPKSSANDEVEFESGKIARELKQKQLRDLESGLNQAISDVLKENPK